MLNIPIAAFFWGPFFAGLAFIALAVLALWVWQKNKNNANLLTLIGAAALGLGSFCVGVGIRLGDFYSILLAGGAIVLLIGYYLTVKPMVAEQMASLKAKMESLKDSTAEKSDDGDKGGE